MNRFAFIAGILALTLNITHLRAQEVVCAKTLQMIVNSPGGLVYLYSTGKCEPADCTMSDSPKLFYFLQTVTTGCFQDGNGGCTCNHAAPLGETGGDTVDYICDIETTLRPSGATLVSQMYLRAKVVIDGQDKMFYYLVCEMDVDGVAAKRNFLAFRLAAAPRRQKPCDYGSICPINPGFDPLTIDEAELSGTELTFDSKTFEVFQYEKN